jgi:hypothetical protein
MRDLADVSTNLQPNDRARFSPSVAYLCKQLSHDACWFVVLTLSGHLTLAFQVALVANHYHREVVLVLDSQNLLLERCDFVEALLGSDRVDQEEALAGAHVLLSHSRVLFLAGSVENVEESDLIVNDALLAVGI